MTEQEAIEFIELIHTCDAEKLDEALSMAISALQKQIPMKPIVKDMETWSDEITGLTCPKCGCMVSDSYCGRCGQRQAIGIDWTEVEK